MAFVDGGAPGRVGVAIRPDPALNAAADAYARTQRQLQQRLFRFDCPSPQLLGEYDLDLLAPAERTRIAAHVVGCHDIQGGYRNFPGSPTDGMRTIVASRRSSMSP